MRDPQPRLPRLDNAKHANLRAVLRCSIRLAVPLRKGPTLHVVSILRKLR